MRGTLGRRDRQQASTWQAAERRPQDRVQPEGSPAGERESARMRRVLPLASIAFALLAVPASAEVAVSGGPSYDASSCAEPAETTATASGMTGGGDSSAGRTVPSSSGTPVSWDGGEGQTAGAAGDGVAGDAAGAAGDAPAAVVAQEPEPEPQPDGPGEEQPPEPGGEPQEPSPPIEEPGGEAPGAETGGGLPRTGLEALQLALLGLVLLLVGARLRALALRRRRRPVAAPRSDRGVTRARAAMEAQQADAEQGANGYAANGHAANRPAANGHVANRNAAHGHAAHGHAAKGHAAHGHAAKGHAAHGHAAHRDTAHGHTVPPGHPDWSFPDPDEPAPTGLLPSTASARRAARARGLEPQATD
jgi:hypothetical protein